MNRFLYSLSRTRRRGTGARTQVFGGTGRELKTFIGNLRSSCPLSQRCCLNTTAFR
jgi:hypothetical protein